MLRRHVTGFFAVGEEEIGQAMQFAYERLTLVIEPLSVVALVPLAQAEASTRRQAGRRGAYWRQCGMVAALATSGQDRA